MPVVWAVGPSHRIASGDRPRDATQYFDRGDSAIRLDAAVNETVGFELVLSAIERPAAGLKLEVDELVGDSTAISRRAFRFYRHWPIAIERYPNWYLRVCGLRESRQVPDALVPLDVQGTSGGLGRASEAAANFELVLLAHQSLPLYVEIKVPADARPQTYRSAVRVRDPSGAVSGAAIELVVRDLFLSRAENLPVVARVQLGPIIAAHGGPDPQNVQAALKDTVVRSSLDRAFAMLQEHGLSPHTTEVLPFYSQDGAGGVSFDWTDYDAFCGPLIGGSAYEDKRPAFAWPLPISARLPDPAQYEGFRSTSYAAVLQDCLAAAKSHFEEHGWLKRSFVGFDWPETPNPTASDYEIVRSLIAATHRADTRLQFLSMLAPQSMKPFGWYGHLYEDLSGEVDVLATPARFQHVQALRHLHQAGKRTWLVPDRPPYSGSLAVEAPPSQSRSIAWQAFLQGHEAVYLPKVSDWPADVLEAPIREHAQATDSWLLYPGAFFGLEEPVPSLRLKQLQLGLQEYQYLRLLEEHGRGETARLLAGSLIKACGLEACGDNYQDGLPSRRVDDPEVWDMARRLLCQETESAVRESTGANFEQTQNMGLWAEFLSATRRIELWGQGARLKIDPRPRREGFIQTYELGIRNELRIPLEGEISLPTLPAGANVVGGPIKVGPMGEMQEAVRKVVVETTQVPPCDLDGHHEQAIILDLGTTGRLQVPVTLSVVRVPIAPNPITIDGSLRDWTPAESNVAGDFRLVGERYGHRPAASQTVAYFCRSEDNLYVAIRAATPPVGLRREGEGNVVEYEDLWPVSGDLVEILIDPTGVGTLSDDLFHMVIKSTGDPVFERGVGVQPPIGQVRGWPGRRPAYCVVQGREGWTAELVISLSAFGEAARRSRVWGINLARLEPQRGEYSDWARAPRYCYDPRTLGNLIWAD